MTKDELIAENARLQDKVKTLEEQDTTLRQELSAALDAPTKKESGYSNDCVYVTYNWYEIFREVGKLLEKKRYINLEDRIEDLISADETIWNALRDKFPKEFPNIPFNL